MMNLINQTNIQAISQRGAPIAAANYWRLPKSLTENAKISKSLEKSFVLQLCKPLARISLHDC